MAWMVAQALESWGAADGTSPAEAHPGPRMVTPDPLYPLLEELAVSAPMRFRAQSYVALGCAWGSGPSGLAHWQKAYELDPAGLLGDFANPAHAEARSYHIETAADAWQKLVKSLPEDPASWPASSFTDHVPHQWNFLCMGQAGCQLGPCMGEDATACTFHPAADVMAELFAPSSNTIRSQIGNSYSHWVDLGNVESARSILPPGVTEDWNAPTYASSVTAWKQGKTFAAPMSEEAVKASAISTTTLMLGAASESADP